MLYPFFAMTLRFMYLFFPYSPFPPEACYFPPQLSPIFTYHVGVFDVLENGNVVELDVEVLVDALQRASY